MEKVVIVGAGGLGREVKWLIDRINQASMTWDLIGFVDDGITEGTEVAGIPVIGGVNTLLEMDDAFSVVCAIASPRVRKEITERLRQKDTFKFPTLIDPSVKMSSSVKLGDGCIICVSNTLTIDITIGDFTIINPASTVGHDASIGAFVTIYPGCNISGNVHIGQLCEIGTGTQVIQGILIGDSTVVGAGSVVIRDLPGHCTAVGVPAEPIKFHEG